MSDFKKIQQELNTSRNQKADENIALLIAKEQLLKLEAKEKELKRTSSKEELERSLQKIKEEKERFNELINQNLKKKKFLNDKISGFIKEFGQIEDPSKSIENLEDSYPFLLFPLRLETRFKSTGNQKQLWLRVYPDDCQVNIKQELLTESELTNAKNFWIEMWKAGSIEELERGAWRSLVNSHGSGRASWIIERYEPANTKPVKVNKNDIVLTLISNPDLLLTAAEETAANVYWIDILKGKGNSQKETDAFTILINATSNGRAAEIKEKYIPVNLSDEIAAGAGRGDAVIQIAKLDLPKDDTINTSSTSWTQAPKATALPDRFAAICYSGNSKKTTFFGNPVVDNLTVGPDPSLPKNEQIKSEDGELKVNEELRWMVDFEKAIEVGMGVKINLTAQEAISGFDKMFVLGLRLSSDENSGKEIVEKLFTDHFLSNNGMGLIRQGTPTNNTEDEDSGYSWLDNPDESYDRIFKKSEEIEEKIEYAEKSDGQKLAEYLGLDNNIFNEMPNANGKDQIESIAMNKALFPATLGYFMEEMMTPVFSDNDIEDTKSFFSNFVSGRGPIPAIRIGKQPYGILPVSAFSGLRFYESDNFIHLVSVGNSRTRFLTRLHNLISKIDLTWNNLLPNVSFVGKDGVDPHQILLDVIGLHANSVEFHQRYAQSLLQIYNQIVLQFRSWRGETVYKTITERGKIILQQLGYDIGDEKIPILEKFFLSKPNLLSGPLVDDVPSSEIKSIREYTTEHKNYIEWLASSDPEKIRIMDFGGNPAPSALLFLLLRHSLMQSQSGAGVKTLLAHGVITDKKIFHDPEFINVQQNGNGKSKFEHLYSAQPKITGSDKTLLIDHLYNPAVLKGSDDAKNLRETIEALKLLEKTPTARLERLLVEHFDCCNYRIDAWKTGLINYKLIEQREIKKEEGKPSKGLYIGAYGWLHDVKPENKILSDVNLSDELKKIFIKAGEVSPQTDDKNLGYIHAPSLNQAATAAILRNAYESHKSSVIPNPYSISLSSDRVRVANNFLEGIRNGQSLSALLGYRFQRGLHDKYSLDKGEVDKFIFPLRKKFPLVADNLVDTKTGSGESIETIEARNVIDGLKLINHVHTTGNNSYPFGFTVGTNPEDLPVASAKEKKAIDEEVDSILNVHDAISDMVISEEVYQVVQGNFERAAGNADAFSKGSYPPEIEVVNTPRTGITITQRVAVHFDTSADAVNSPLAGIPMTIRAKAEASVNKWLSRILPVPDKVLCKIIYTNPLIADKEEIISQKDLGLQPVDLLYLLNMDAEQAMTALDDRITNYVRYELSKHSKTSLKIDYTAPIDNADKTKISFFEIAALLKSLRKILIEPRFLNPSDLILPASSATTKSEFDINNLKQRINEIKINYEDFVISLENISDNTVSISALTNILKSELDALTTDTNQIDSLITQYVSDLKDSVPDPSIVNARTAEFRNKISVFISDVTVLDNLEIMFNDSLNDFVNDFPNFDDFIETVTKKFTDINLIINSQTGIGFMYDGLAGIYESIMTKLNKVIERWEKKILEYNEIIFLYNAAATDEERFEHLRKAEITISSNPTFPLPINHADYKTNIIDVKRADFDNALNNLKDLKTSDKETLIEFFTVAEPVIQNIKNHDVIYFDPDSESNKIKKEKNKVILLREDIVTAVENIKNELNKRIDEAAALIVISDDMSSGIEKVNQIILAAKKLMSEDALILPHFKFDDKQGIEFEKAFGNSDSILEHSKNSGGKVFPVEDWLFGTARVRDKLAQWENINFLIEGFKKNTSIELTPMQFPFLETTATFKDRWLALKFRDNLEDYIINTDKLLYTAHFAESFDISKTQCGILIDDWTELIPDNEETTGITFHYDQPNSEPPQVMLLVTPPVFSGHWKWNNIIDALEETFEMIKKRAVEPTHIEKTGYAQFLPTTMMAVTLYLITMATNLAMNNSIYNKID
ncbi:MAG: hypothetical protein M3R36_04005 [Bacteroidota bacterium]|nr:hypothetical protein [Bacteroidota bacterium]